MPQDDTKFIDDGGEEGEVEVESVIDLLVVESMMIIPDELIDID